MPSVEQIAIDFVKEHYKNKGYCVRKGQKGYDLTISKNGTKHPVEVKGRSKTWPFINTTMEEYKVLKSNPQARLMEVIVNGETEEVECAYEFSYNNFNRERPTGYALYPKRTIHNKIYQKES